GAAPAISKPAEKARPLPSSRIARTSSRCSASSRACSSWSSIPESIAFSFSGRFSVMRATSPRFSTCTVDISVGRQLAAQARRYVVANVEAQVLHRCVEPVPERPRVHASLHALTDVPVLQIHEVPEIRRIRRIEIHVVDGVRVEQQATVDARLFRTPRPENEHGDVVHREAQHQVRIDKLAKMPLPLDIVQAGKREPVGRACARERVRSGLLRDTCFPIELRPTIPAKLGHDFAQFGMDAGAVVALVVVLEYHFPVRRDRIFLSPARTELVERISRHPVGYGSKLVTKRFRAPAGLHKNKSAPTVERDLLEADLFFFDIHLPCLAQLAVQPVSPGMVRAADVRKELAAFLLVAGRVYEFTSAMAANVVERPQLPVVTAHDNNALTSDFDSLVTTCRYQVFLPCHAGPLVEKNFLAFPGKP